MNLEQIFNEGSGDLSIMECKIEIDSIEVNCERGWDVIWVTNYYSCTRSLIIYYIPVYISNNTLHTVYKSFINDRAFYK